MHKRFQTFMGLFMLAACSFSCGTAHAGHGSYIPQDTTNTEPAADTTVVDFLALGDSYTIGEAVAEEGRWPVLLAKALKEKGVRVAKPEIRARTGWTTTDLLDTLKTKPQKPSYGLVSLLIGVNNQYQGLDIDTYKAEFRTLLRKALAYADNDRQHVFVLSIPDYSVTPFGKNNKKTAEEIDQYNAINRAISKSLGVAYYNITPISREAADEAALVAKDGLHPSAAMYERWVKLIVNSVHEGISE